jgi:hypothetical protein
MSPNRFLILTAAILLGASQARGFVREFDQGVPVEWTKNRTVLMHLSLPFIGTLSDGFANLDDSAEDALNAWNQQLVHMRFAVDKGSILPPSDTDANTSVTMSDAFYGETFGDNVLAVTLVTPRNGRLIEADVVFNRNVKWDSYRGPLKFGVEDFHRVALHEFGHVVGLDHPDQATPKQTAPAIMKSLISNIDSLQADDINGAHNIYDSGPDYLSSNPAPNLVNLATRAFVGSGANVVIGGFIIQGSQPATVILRGIGLSLPALGINNALKDPVIELRSASGALISTSDDWIDDPWASTIASYHLDPSNSRESAILTTLAPGSYTVILRAFDDADGPGTGLIELYDLHTSGGRAGNIATRGQVSSGNPLIGGFIVGGNQTKTVVVRALGPSTGVGGALSDPAVELRDQSGSLVASNDNWGNGPDAAQIQAEGFAPGNPAESALQATLNPGAYTAIVKSANGATGIGLVEVYDLSPGPN